MSPGKPLAERRHDVLRMSPTEHDFRQMIVGLKGFRFAPIDKLAKLERAIKYLEKAQTAFSDFVDQFPEPPR